MGLLSFALLTFLYRTFVPARIQSKIQSALVAIMGMTHSTARWVAPLSFAIDFAAQQYGMLSSPNMKDVHDAHLSFWSPQPFFIAGFFFPQQLFQLAWLYRLYKLDPKKEPREVQTMVDFVPYYAVGNLCIASTYSKPIVASVTY